MEVLMLKLSLKPGEYITLGDNIKIIFSGALPTTYICWWMHRAK